MRSGITRRWLGHLLITVLLVLLVEGMFLYNYTRSYYNGVQQTMYRRFSSVSGQLKMYTGDTVQSTAATRSVALRRMVEQFADKDKYEFMLLDSYGGVIASSSGTNADGIRDRQPTLSRRRRLLMAGVAVYRTQSGEVVMAAVILVPLCSRRRGRHASRDQPDPGGTADEKKRHHSAVSWWWRPFWCLRDVGPVLCAEHRGAAGPGGTDRSQHRPG